MLWKHIYQVNQYLKMNKDSNQKHKLRYSDQGNIHMDFHGATNTTIEFIIKNYGIEIMNDIFFKVGKDVYKDLRMHIKNGDIEVLAEHWQHYFGREGADFDIDIKNDEIILTVHRCTAYEHVKKITGFVSPHFCDQTIKTNEALAEGTAFSIDTEILGEASCRQIIRRRL